VSDLLALAERCEAATGSGRDVDLEWEVHFACGVQRPEPLAYTASLDAAMTLVPEDREWVLANYRSPKTVARVGAFNQGSAATPALALTAAALRARASLEHPNPARRLPLAFGDGL
jgi:hypothetical protein